jgi:hypothetical protein
VFQIIREFDVILAKRELAMTTVENKTNVITSKSKSPMLRGTIPVKVENRCFLT